MCKQVCLSVCMSVCLSVCRPNYVRYDKILTSKIVHLKEAYKFYFDHFLEKCTVFILIKKTSLQIKTVNSGQTMQDTKKC